MRTIIIILLLTSHSILQGQSSQPVSNQNNTTIQCAELIQWPPLSAEESDPRGNIVSGYREGSIFIYTLNNQVLIQSQYYFDSAFDNAGKPGFSELRQRTMVFTKAFF
jgi:hypothetical protein